MSRDGERSTVQGGFGKLNSEIELTAKFSFTYLMGGSTCVKAKSISIFQAAKTIQYGIEQNYSGLRKGKK